MCLRVIDGVGLEPAAVRRFDPLPGVKPVVGLDGMHVRNQHRQTRAPVIQRPDAPLAQAFGGVRPHHLE